MKDFSKYLRTEYSFKAGGETENCASLAYKVLVNEYGLDAPKFSYDGDSRKASQAILCYIDNWTHVEQRTIGSLVIFHIGDLVHCGVVVSHTHFIHCLKGRNTTIERLDAIQWRSRIQGYYLWEQSQQTIAGRNEKS